MIPHIERPETQGTSRWSPRLTYTLGRESTLQSINTLILWQICPEAPRGHPAPGGHRPAGEIPEGAAKHHWVDSLDEEVKGYTCMLVKAVIKCNGLYSFRRIGNIHSEFRQITV